MKSYRQYLLEADYKRYLKKNDDLTDDQIIKIDSFFNNDKKAAKDYEKKWGWQSEYPRIMRWDAFEKIMGKYKSGRKLVLTSIKIPGSKGKDYQPVRLKEKGFIANIPLNWDTAKFMNSCDYGSLSVNYCIGWKDDRSYWKDHVITLGKVPIYITDGAKKWVVMIKRDNKSYEVWDKFNKKDISKGNSEPISGFSIKKELIGSKMSKMYDEIREEFYMISKGHLHQRVIDAFNLDRIELDIDTREEDSKAMKWFNQNYNTRNFEDGSVYINDSILIVRNGKITNTFVDSGDIAVRIGGSACLGTSIYFSNNRKSSVYDSRIYKGTIVEKTVLNECTVIDGYLYDCHLNTCIIRDGDFKRCVIGDPKTIDGGSYTDCEVNGSGFRTLLKMDSFISFRNGSILYTAIEKGNYHGVSFKNCTIRGGQFDAKCTFDDKTQIDRDSKTLTILQ